MSSPVSGPVSSPVSSPISGPASDTSPVVPLPSRPALPEGLADVLNATGIGTLVLDNDLNIRWFTPAIQSLYRLRTGDVGRPLVEMLPLSDDPQLLTEAARVLAGLDYSEAEVAGQSNRWFKRRIQPCLTPDGQTDGVVMTFVDITDQRQIYAALAAAENRAQLATAAKSRFLAVASHDLRQPLQTMVILQGLLAGCVTGTKAKDLVGRMAETLGSMSRMLDVLLDINQIEAGVVEPNLSDFPVMLLLQDLFDEFSTTATSRGVDMRVVRSSLFVRSDPVLLEQMLRNLVSNALKYAPGKRVLIGCRRSGADMLIEVRDSGIGIPAGEMASIFDEYYQISADAPGLGQGMGLGLNIVQRLGAILGHPVSARSALGKGSAFTVRVPCAVGPARKAAAPVPNVAPARAGGTGHILVVEDDLQVGNLLDLLLVDQGHRVTMVETAAAALDLVARGLTPDLLLTDYNLPGGMDGLALARSLRESRGLAAILLSGDITTEAMRRIAQEDVLHLAKPVTVGRLAAAIASLLKSVPQTDAAITPKAVAKATSGAVVHIVDDDGGFRGALRMLLEEGGMTVVDHASCEQFLQRYDPATSGCLLLDAYLPGMDGLGLLAHLHAAESTLPVIMITGQSDVLVAVAAMKAGAADFLEKPVSGADICASIDRAMAAGGRKAPLVLADLTPRQAEVLDAVMAGKASKTIAFDLGISQRTVESHRAAIMDRVGARSVPELVRKVLGVA